MSNRRRLSAALLMAALGLSAALILPTSAAAAGTGQLTLTNPDVLPDNTAVVLSKIQNPADSSQRMHDKVSVQLKNTGTAGLTVSSLTATGPVHRDRPVEAALHPVRREFGEHHRRLHRDVRRLARGNGDGRLERRRAPRRVPSP